MAYLDYIISKSEERERQFMGVIHCLKIFKGFPPDMDKKKQLKFIKKHKDYIKEKYNIEFIGYK